MTDTHGSSDAGRRHDATIRVPYPDAALAESVERAIRLEAGDIDGARSEASVRRDGASLEVTIEADDPSALRAAKRTWCGLVDVAERTASLVE